MSALSAARCASRGRRRGTAIRPRSRPPAAPGCPRPGPPAARHVGAPVDDRQVVGLSGTRSTCRRCAARRSSTCRCPSARTGRRSGRTPGRRRSSTLVELDRVRREPGSGAGGVAGDMRAEHRAAGAPCGPVVRVHLLVGAVPEPERAAARSDPRGLDVPDDLGGVLGSRQDRQTRGRKPVLPAVRGDVDAVDVVVAQEQRLVAAVRSV